MNYDLYVNNEIVGSGLSRGELNQWIIELDNELAGDNQDNFRRDLGFRDEDNFEDYLYSCELGLPLKLNHLNDSITIKESDF